MKELYTATGGRDNGRAHIRVQHIVHAGVGAATRGTA
jgi:hypothetical protein